MMSDEDTARLFHETYERLAPQFGYETRPDTKQFDPHSANGRLMIEVCRVVTSAQAAEIAALRDELETERMRLAACSVAALSNTPETVAERLARDHPYWSASYQDVCNIVDSEMALRARLAVVEGALKQYADPENWSCSDHSPNHDCQPDRKGCCLDVWDMDVNGFQVARDALAAGNRGHQIAMHLPTTNLKELEECAITQALTATGGNRTKAAPRLGISVRTLQRKIKLLGPRTATGENHSTLQNCREWV